MGTDHRMRADKVAPDARGFTLIELVVALVIAAVLAAIAVPSYLNYTRKSHRTEAKTALLDIAGLEERYYSVNNLYSQTTTDLGYTGNWPVTIGSGYYQLFPDPAGFVAATPPTANNPAGTPATFRFVAQAIGDQANDAQCPTFTIDSTGVQGPAATVATCWH
jgi:type IV pilus assembly protein PilE